MSHLRTKKAPAADRSTCRDCGRDVIYLPQPDGSRMKMDTELRSVVLWPDGRELQTARLPHSGVCRPEGRRPTRRGNW